MSRRRRAAKRPLIADPKFNSPLVTRLVNTVMERGKKSLAQRVVYGAFDKIIEKIDHKVDREECERFHKD